jgi:hypothetical protein
MVKEVETVECKVVPGLSFKRRKTIYTNGAKKIAATKNIRKGCKK